MSALFDKSHRIIPLADWKRAELFRSFRRFDDPCFTVSFEAPILPLRRMAETRGDSFFLLALFAIAEAYNAVPEMRMRFAGPDAVAEYAVAHPSTPLMTSDGENYRQTALPYAPTFAEFTRTATPVVESVRRGNAGGQSLEGEAPNCFCASCVPWISAAGYVPATYMKNQDIHVITWFRMTPEGTTLLNCRFNHCFTDGLHVSRFFTRVAENFRCPERL